MTVRPRYGTRATYRPRGSALALAAALAVGTGCAPASPGATLRSSALSPARNADALRPMPTVCAAGPAGRHTTPYWASLVPGRSRVLRVRLTVMDDATAAWRLDGAVWLEQAMAAWNRAGLPVRLARAEVGARDHVPIRVLVTRRLPLDPDDHVNAYRAGVTHLRFDDRGALAEAQVVVAEETPRGSPYARADQYATLLHELGHALGVPHSDEMFALMSPRAVVASLTPHDVALAREVYARAACTTSAAVAAANSR